MKKSNTKAAQLQGLIEAVTGSGLTVTAVEVAPRRLLIRTEAIAMPTSLTVAKSYADWKAEERRRNG